MFLKYVGKLGTLGNLQPMGLLDYYETFNRVVTVFLTEHRAVTTELENFSGIRGFHLVQKLPIKSCL